MADAALSIVLENNKRIDTRCSMIGQFTAYKCSRCSESSCQFGRQQVSCLGETSKRGGSPRIFGFASSRLTVTEDGTKILVLYFYVLGDASPSFILLLGLVEVSIWIYV